MQEWSREVDASPTPPPTVPPGLVQLMEELSKQVLLHKPEDIHRFCAQHLEQLLKIRDERNGINSDERKPRYKRKEEVMKSKTKLKRQKQTNEALILNVSKYNKVTPHIINSNKKELYTKSTELKIKTSNIHDETKFDNSETSQQSAQHVVAPGTEREPNKQDNEIVKVLNKNDDTTVKKEHKEIVQAENNVIEIETDRPVNSTEPQEVMTLKSNYNNDIENNFIDSNYKVTASDNTLLKNESDSIITEVSVDLDNTKINSDSVNKVSVVIDSELLRDSAELLIISPAINNDEEKIFIGDKNEQNSDVIGEYQTNSDMDDQHKQNSHINDQHQRNSDANDHHKQNTEVNGRHQNSDANNQYATNSSVIDQDQIIPDLNDQHEQSSDMNDANKTNLGKNDPNQQDSEVNVQNGQIYYVNDKENLSSKLVVDSETEITNLGKLPENLMKNEIVYDKSDINAECYDEKFIIDNNVAVENTDNKNIVNKKVHITKNYNIGDVSGTPFLNTTCDDESNENKKDTSLDTEYLIHDNPNITSDKKDTYSSINSVGDNSMTKHCNIDQTFSVNRTNNESNGHTTSEHFKEVEYLVNKNINRKLSIDTVTSDHEKIVTAVDEEQIAVTENNILDFKITTENSSNENTMKQEVYVESKDNEKTEGITETIDNINIEKSLTLTNNLTDYTTITSNDNTPEHITLNDKTVEDTLINEKECDSVQYETLIRDNSNTVEKDSYLNITENSQIQNSQTIIEDVNANRASDDEFYENGGVRQAHNQINRKDEIDLEMAAITIQKVFKDYMNKKASSSEDNSDNGIDEDLLDRENLSDGMENNTDECLHATRLISSNSKSSLILQTVNEEKSLSLSTDESSTLSSAATIIQAHVRGYLVRSRRCSNKNSSSDTVAISEDGGTHENTPRAKTVLKINIQEKEHFMTEDSLDGSIELSLDSAPVTQNLHPLGYNKDDRKPLKREDAVQSITPPTDSSFKLSEDNVPSNELVILDGNTDFTEITQNKQAPINEFNATNANGTEEISQNLIENIEKPAQTENTTERANRDKHINIDTTGNIKNTETDTVDGIVNNINDNKELVDKTSEHLETDRICKGEKKTLIRAGSDDKDVITALHDMSECRVLHTSEFHDAVFPTGLVRTDSSVVREFEIAFVYFIKWNAA